MTVKRSPTDTCLFCHTNPATKTNSHILSRFISTNFLGPKGTQGKGFEISSETALKKKTRTVQDSPKESYILCEECEEYFSVLEGLSSDTFSNWQQKLTSGEFIIKKKHLLEVLECSTSDPTIIRLFVYSLFWRGSISNHSLFENFELAADFEEDLRLLLLKFKSQTKADFLQALKTNSALPVYPFTIITARTFKDETSNLILAPYTYDPYCLLVDKFSFMLYRNISQMKEQFEKDFSNIQPDDCRMMIVNESFWYNVMVKRPMQLLAKQATTKDK